MLSELARLSIPHDRAALTTAAGKQKLKVVPFASFPSVVGSPPVDSPEAAMAALHRLPGLQADWLLVVPVLSGPWHLPILRRRSAASRCRSPASAPRGSFKVAVHVRRYTDSTYFSRNSKLLAHLELSVDGARGYLHEQKKSTAAAMAAAGRWLVPITEVDSAVASYNMFRAAASAGRLTERLTVSRNPNLAR